MLKKTMAQELKAYFYKLRILTSIINKKKWETHKVYDFSYEIKNIFKLITKGIRIFTVKKMKLKKRCLLLWTFMLNDECYDLLEIIVHNFIVIEGRKKKKVSCSNSKSNFWKEKSMKFIIYTNEFKKR